jgi:hypothetical protein
VSLSQLSTSTLAQQTLQHNQLDLEIASHNLPLAHLQELCEDLEINNLLGRMVTFYVASQGWVDRNRFVLCPLIFL